MIYTCRSTCNTRLMSDCYNNILFTVIAIPPSCGCYNAIQVNFMISVLQSLLARTSLLIQKLTQLQRNPCKLAILQIQKSAT